MKKRKHKYSLKREKWKTGYWYVLRDEIGKRHKWIKWHSNKRLRSVNYNKISSFVKRRYWEKKKAKPSKQRKAFRQIQKAESLAKSRPLIREMEKKIRREGVRRIKGERISFRGVADLSKAVGIYKELLKDKIVDKKMMRDVISHRDKILKHRLLCQVRVFGERGLMGIINIGGILIEKDIEAHKFWMGRYIDSNMFNVFAEEFKGLLNNPKIYVARSTHITAGTIVAVETEWSFA